MKFICDTALINREISIAGDIISSKNALSILSNVYLSVNEDRLLIKATDLKVGFETEIPVQTEISGSTTVFCDKLLGILKNMPEGDALFQLEENGTMIISTADRRIEYQLKTISADKYPEIQEISSDSYFEIPQKDLIEMISQTILAVSTDETRYFMNGVFIEKPESNLIMVATDGRRLSYIERPIDIGMTELPGSIVPPKVLTLVRKLASGEGNVQAAVTEKNIFFRFDNRKLFSALIEGQFPNYRRVIPDNQTNSVTVGKDDLETALKRVALLVEQKSKRIYLSVNGDVLRINSEDSEIGKASEEIPCTYGGEETTFALNYQYLMDPLRVMDEQTIRLRFTEPSKAMTLEGESEGDFFHIIMPMQVD